MWIAWNFLVVPGEQKDCRQSWPWGVVADSQKLDREPSTEGSSFLAFRAMPPLFWCPLAGQRLLSPYKARQRAPSLLAQDGRLSSLLVSVDS